MPIEFSEEIESQKNQNSLQNVSAGGLCFYSGKPIPEGSKLTVDIPNLRYPFSEKCVVMWCRYSKDGFEIGVKFEDEKTNFRMRMIEQICYIEEYRNKISKKEKRELSWKEASDEWIAKYAGKFPGLNK